MAESSGAEAKKLWDTYYMLTQELLKFINKQDIDEFLDSPAFPMGLPELL